ncbi:serine hydroxymethyltransferase [Patescibacteria group bacterium]|nr:serine hydroxymethyltransferase [Patescibacteria group bacterium]MBU1922564.1 serine hydroxymethyltransferase [Patescibacteria group bacterium]
MENLQKIDLPIARSLQRELERQRHTLEMIPSENFVSLAVLEALGSVATNKYAEGYPGKRYYGGCEFIDEIETLAIERAKELFGANYINVQPLSGAPANMAAYFGLLEPGDVILGMDLSHGGHLTHGSPVTFMSKIFDFKRYRTTTDGLIDYTGIHDLAVKFKPKMILMGYSAYSREIDFQKIHEIAQEVEAYTMADIAHIAGLIAAGEMNNPCPLFDIVTTTTHKTLRGPRGGMIMCKDQDVAKRINKAVFPGLQGGPHENNIAAKAVAFKEALQPEFKEYIKQVKKNAKVLEQEIKKTDIRICFGTTDNHLLLLDVTPKGISGKQAEQALDKAGITVNKNMIPDDTRSPMDPSGIRIGTPAITTRGMKEDEMKQIAAWIEQALNNYDNDAELEKIRNDVKELTERFPIYPELKY